MIMPSAPGRTPRDRLPRDRDLPDPRERLDRIIQAAGRPPVRRRRFVYLGAAAAAAVIIALVAAGSLIMPNRPSVVASPAPQTPSVTPTGEVHRLGDRVELRDLTITVRDVRQDSDGLAVAAQTCFTATGSQDASADDLDWSRWRVVTDRDTYAAEDFPSFDRRGQSGWPVYPTDPPTGRSSSCVEGWLPFAALGPEDERVMISYQDRLGRSARWMIR